MDGMERARNLSPAKRALLLKALQKDTASEVQTGRIPRRPDANNAPLSFSQQRLWLLEQMGQGGAALNIAVGVRLAGWANLHALEQSLNVIVNRHDLLRTTFHQGDDRAFQVAGPPVFSLRIPIVELIDDASLDETIDSSIRIESERPFDLEHGPLLRAVLLRINEQSHILLVAMHHIACDGWSMGVLVRELAALYRCLSTGEAHPLPDLPIQYADFAAWQNERLEGPFLESLTGYWKEQLNGAPEASQLPADRPRPAIQSFRGASRSMVIHKEACSALRDLSERAGATLFMALLAAFDVLMYRWGGQEDVSVGTFIANRDRPETAGLIGFFVNSLVLRADMSRDPTFRELLDRVRQTALDGYVHQELPFELLLEALQADRDPSRTPLFQVMLVLQNAPLPELVLPGVKVEYVTHERQRSNFDLTLWMETGASGELLGTIEYSLELFDEATIDRIIGHYRTLIESIIADPDMRVSSLRMLTGEEHRLLSEWNSSSLDFDHSACVSELFEARARESADSIAAVDDKTQISYQELNRRANQLARHLRNVGVGPEVIVGLCFERSVDLLVALLGTLKAGGAYLPLDLGYNTERLAFMIEDSRASILLTDQQLDGRLAGSVSLISIKKEWESISSYSAEDLGRTATAENLAYVVYTSGSTGKPKGTLVTHRSLVSASLGWEQAYELDKANKVHLQMASLSFDVFTGDWVRALCSGGTLVFCPRDILLDAVELNEFMVRNRIEIGEFVPVVLRGVKDFLLSAGRRLDFIKLLIVGSDTWNASEHLEMERLCGVGARVVDSYGLTEATIDSTFYERADRGLSIEGMVPIGRPFPNTRIHILSKAMQQVAAGIAGELYVGGEGVARGYAYSPGLTADRFVPGAFGGPPGSRWYRTGDLARYLGDGNIEFLGRADNQVKIRGYRIELGEIESVISQYPGVREVVALAREDRPGDRRLVAYVVCNQDVASGELKSFLKEKLPDYMRPKTILTIDSFPKTPNGKVDRKALPAPDWSTLQSEDEFVPPRNEIDEIMVGIWASVLKRDRVGIRDNFFELGGHSLLAASLVAKLREAFQIDLPLRALFEKPSVEELAVAVEEMLIEDIEGLSEQEVLGLLN